MCEQATLERIIQTVRELDEPRAAEVLDFAEFVKTRRRTPEVIQPARKIDWTLFERHAGCYDGSRINREELYDRGLR